MITYIEHKFLKEKNTSKTEIIMYTVFEYTDLNIGIDVLKI